MKEIELSNTSLVPMTYTLRVVDDGTKPVHKATNLLSQPILEDVESSLEDLKEFTICPSTGRLAACSSVLVSVEFTPNHLGESIRHLVVDVDKVGKALMSLPIKYSLLHHS
ncbi:unnamed protein product [Protopolystoma xenopodis]|uniref:Integrin alpha-2 domain-containing protein n=1 Tax=Protopolystoma xenopodis TaxID=117903 RepID=A0A3S5ANF4_9PLAT|nr:unnamed protein product [Protopolystoma xenopodis]